MNTEERFSQYHPVINFVFFLGAMVFGMFLLHPVFLTCSVFLSAVYYLTVRGSAGWRTLRRFGVLFLLLPAVNPLLNAYGETVLFFCPWGRPYTLEALYYGMALAAMMVSVLLWFSSYNEVMTSDKFLYLFGRLIPSASLILTMVLRLVPDYQRKTEQVRGARKGIGLAGEGGSVKQRIRQGMDILSSMMSWALEGGIVMADSMKSRGYGCGKRTRFSIYRFGKRDRYLLIFMICLMAGVVFCAFQGGTAAAYTPELSIAGPDNRYMTAGAFFYFLFLAVPTAIHLTEEITWRILRSKI